MVRISVPVNIFISMDFRAMSLGQRLKEERERLGLTIVAFADVAGAKKNTVIDWQKDVSSPPAVKLSALAEVGVDVLYVLTGQRSQAAPPPEPSITLNRKERAFWDMFKELDEQDQREIYQDIKEKKRIADMEKRLQEYESGDAPVKKLG